MNRVSIPIGVRIGLSEGWCDITDTLEGDSPFTLAKEDGVGAFQFSSARYEGGLVPSADCEDLLEMLHTFFRDRDLGEAIDVRTHAGDPSFAAASSQRDGFVRVWFVSNGRSFVLASYTSDRDAPPEVQQCEEMVGSLEFEE